MNWVCSKCCAALRAATGLEYAEYTIGNLVSPCVYCGVVDKAAICLEKAPMPPPFEVQRAPTKPETYSGENKAPILVIQNGREICYLPPLVYKRD